MKLHQCDSDIFHEFRVSCKECSGLCYMALYFSKYDGFPADKAAGTPCRYLDSNFCYSIHRELQFRQMKGCLAYDYCDAGQMVTRLYGEENWKSNPGAAQEEFDVFVKIFYLQQTLWYISKVKTLLPAQALWEEAGHYLEELHLLLKSSPQKILDDDIGLLRTNINTLLNQAWQMVREQIASPAKITKKKDYMGHHFRKSKLNDYDFSSTLLIAANFEAYDLTDCNFLGADMRDANIKDADLSECNFLTQGQIDAAVGNRNTRIPEHLIMPVVWL